MAMPAIAINHSNSDTYCGGKLNTMAQAMYSGRVSSEYNTAVIF